MIIVLGSYIKTCKCLCLWEIFPRSQCKYFLPFSIYEPKIDFNEVGGRLDMDIGYPLKQCHIMATQEGILVNMLISRHKA